MSTKAKLLRIYVGEKVHWKSEPLYRAIMFKLKKAGIAGVTISRGIEGYGQLKTVHTTRLLELSADLPIVIESIDTAEKINAIIPEISEMVSRGLIITEDVEVHKWSV